MQVTLPKLPLWEMGSTSEDTQLQITTSQNHPGGLPRSSPSMVIDTGFLPTLHYRVPQQGSHQSQSDRWRLQTSYQTPCLKCQGIPLLAIPPIQWPRRRVTPQSRRGTPGLPEATTSLPSWVFTGGYGQPHGSFLLIPLTQYPREGHQPDSSCIMLANSINLSVDVLYLQEEMNSAMVHLLSARATMDMCYQWVIWETEIGHHQNEINTSEAIREIKAQYATTIRDTAKNAH